MLQRLEGIAGGAGCSLSTVFFQHAIEILGASPLHVSGCSSIAVDDSFFSENQPLLAKNFDFLPLFNDFQILRESHPAQGYSSLELTMSPMAGSHAGINECGLSILYNYAFARDWRRRGVPLSMLVTHFLTNCSRVDDVLEMVDRIPWVSGGILTMGDAHNTLVMVELSNRHCIKRHVNGQWGLATNHYLDPFMQAFEIPSSSRYHPWVLPSPWRGVRIHETSEKRYHDILSFFRERKHVSLGDIKELLADHGDTAGGSNNSVCRHSDIGSTIASAIFFPGMPGVLYCHGKPCATGFELFTFR
jgi:hypothetical protein